MDFSLLWADAPPVPAHALAAIGALALGAVQLVLAKGTHLHRIAGRVWVALMAFVAFSSFFIHELQLIGPWSPIHLLSILTLVSLVQAVRTARAGNIAQHRIIMRSLYLYALVITGAFTLLPGRTMHAVLFGG
ncbi:DUF2306 domain-containing protein [Sulfitobacter albidus]|uniref:DUF2306 domain-containing protein n=1 Tax=Sulfitobacter albidus TaxID=2829501 RepID=A0A975JDI1_9RHOB|nr:DUF2306 domain-containing protein [Sulfitobacter albidus]QUJ76080.1 DUF2306 domain-containing protein [Sulfitobacter albidus]